MCGGEASAVASESGLPPAEGPAETTMPAIPVPNPPIGLPVPRPVQEIWLAPRNAALAVMHLYRRAISPLYGQVCRYYPSCSRYAVDAFQRQGFLAGIALTAWRLLRCNPFTPGGVDDAPERRRPRYAVNSRGFVRPVDRKA